MAPRVPQARHALRALLPPWLRRPFGDSLTTEGLFTVYDVDAENFRSALLARFPSYAPEGALTLIAKDRGIPTGAGESADVLRVRLLLWIDFLELAGLPIGLLLALQATLAPFYPTVRIITQGSIWYTLREGAVGRMLRQPGYAPLPLAPYELGASWPADSPPVAEIERLRLSGLYQRSDQSEVPNWDWDSLSISAGSGTTWSAWVVIYSVGDRAWVTPEPEWGSDTEVWGDGGYWGVDPVAPTSTDIGPLLRLIAARFKPARCWIRQIITSFDQDLFDPDEPVNAGLNPDGLFGDWYKVVDGENVSTKFADARYSEGVL
jgi:hypothetical protein